MNLEERIKDLENRALKLQKFSEENAESIDKDTAEKIETDLSGMVKEVAGLLKEVFIK